MKQKRQKYQAKRCDDIKNFKLQCVQIIYSLLEKNKTSSENVILTRKYTRTLKKLYAEAELHRKEICILEFR